MRFDPRTKQHYIFRPTQIARRVMPAPLAGADGTVAMTLPWRLPIAFCPDEMIGSSIQRTGLFDLLVSECLTRLTAPGDLTVDAGANIGHMTSIFAWRSGPGGCVHAFEPHPDNARILRSNVERWSGPHLSKIVVHEAGVSDDVGVGMLTAGADFGRNRGTASLLPAGHSTDGVQYEVKLATLDSTLDDRARVGVMKLDVEGHELAALRGASTLLGAGRIRDLIFEEQGGYPSAVTNFLQECGMSLFSLGAGFSRPFVREPGWSAPRGFEARSLLATTAPDRALRMMSRRGWLCLQPKRCNR